MGLQDLIVPIHADAMNLPFADGYFDAVISVDAYHYFGSNDSCFSKKLRPTLKKGTLVAIAFLGTKYEVHSNIPDEMKPFWKKETLAMWHSVSWWRAKLEHSLSEFTVKEMECFDKAWEEWLSTDNPYAIEDRAMISADGGRYMNLIAVTGKAI